MAKKKEFDINAEMYLDELFRKHYDSWEAKVNKTVVDDLMFLQKYKGELAKAFNEVKGQRNTLVGCMQEIIDFQEEMLALQKDLIKVITGAYPEAKGRIEAIDVENPIT